jgi:hypothetical protein
MAGDTSFGGRRRFSGGQRCISGGHGWISSGASHPRIEEKDEKIEEKGSNVTARWPGRIRRADARTNEAVREDPNLTQMSFRNGSSADQFSICVGSLG